MIPTLEVVSIEAKNVRGARRVKIQPGKVTVFRGRNASGKSSALATVQSIMGGGSLANLARIENGKPQEPEIVLIMGEPGRPYSHKATKNRKGTTVKERVDQSQAFQDVARPQEFLDGLYDQAGSNPVKFINAIEASNPKEFVKLVLEAMPIVLPREEFEAIVGEDAADIAGRAQLATLHPIEEINATVQALYNIREGTNRDAKNAHQASERLKARIPAIVEVAAVRAELDAAEAEARTLAEEVTAERSRIRSAKEAADEASTVAFSDAVKAAKAEYDRVCAAAAATLERVTGEAKAARLAANNAAFEASDAATAALAVKVETLSQKDFRVRELKTAIEQASKDEALSEEAAQADRDEARFKGHSDRLTAKMDALEALKRSLGANLPIAGLEIREEGIYIDGIKARDCNTATKVQMAIQLSTIRQRGTRLPFVVVDGAETLDTETFGALVDSLKKIPGLISFVARVDNCDLVVEDETGAPCGVVEVGPEAEQMAASA